jgi:hypothetical protein
MGVQSRAQKPSIGSMQIGLDRTALHCVVARWRTAPTLGWGNRGGGVTAGEQAAHRSSPTATLAIFDARLHPARLGGAQAAVSDGSAFNPSLERCGGAPQIRGPDMDEGYCRVSRRLIAGSCHQASTVPRNGTNLGNDG